MKSNPHFFVGFVFAMLLIAVPAANAQPLQAKQCPNAPAKTVTASQIFPQRKPAVFPTDNMFPQCLPLLSAVEDIWQAQDLADWDRLANQYCAYSEGWVEREPGKCSAGGPPPICIQDHWVKAPNALETWEKLNAEVRLTRQHAMKAAVCGCMKQELLDATLPSSQPVSHSTSTGLSACLPPSFDCPPGLSCIAGSCTTGPIQLPPGPEIPGLGEVVGHEVVHHAVESAVEHLAKSSGTLGNVAHFAARMFKITGNLYVQVFYGLFDAPITSLHRQQFAANAERLEQLGKAYEALSSDITQQAPSVEAGALPAHGRCYYRASLADLRSRVSQTLLNVKSALNGMRLEQEYKNNECPEVVESFARELEHNIEPMLGAKIEVLAPSLPLRGTQDPATCM